MSSEVWYYELLSRNVMISKSQVHTPYFDIENKKFLNDLSTDEVITGEMCVFEFNKPLITTYRSFIKCSRGFQLRDLCNSICEEWDRITNEFPDWINSKYQSKVINELYIYRDDANITRVVVNFDVPLDSRLSLFEEELKGLPFIVNPPTNVSDETLSKKEPDTKTPVKKTPVKKKITTPIKRASKKKEPVAVASPPIKKQKTVNFDELMSKYNK
jgi:hypothetical protein